MTGPGFVALGVLSVVFWLLPVVAIVWALVTLARLRRGQDQVVAHLAAIRAGLEARP